MSAATGSGPILELDGVWARYGAAGPWALEDVRLAFSPRTHSGILGPNGAGKSTLLRILAGLRFPDRGEARIDGRTTADWERRALSRRLALASPVEEQGFPMRVSDYVALGRSPYLGRFGAPSEGDEAAVERALQHADLQALAERRLDQLSAGELQRARIARALAQEPAILLLDEPTAHLDVGHEMSAFEIIEEIQQKQQVTVVSITHNINMASRFCDRIVLLGRGRVAGDGSPEDVLTAARLSEAFDHSVAVELLQGMGRVAVPVRESRP